MEYNYPAKSRGILPDSIASSAKISGYSATLRRIIVLLFNTLIRKHSFMVEKLESIFRGAGLLV